MTIVTLLGASCTTHQGFEGYRYNPFQYPYDEYYLKAETIPIDSIKVDVANNMVKLEFFGLASYVPAVLFNAKTKALKENEIIYKSDGKVLIIRKEKDNMIGCADEDVRNRNKDLCSAFSSTKEYYNKLFTLTPDDLKSNSDFQAGDKWIVHRKGFTFENAIKLDKYVGNGIEAFVSNYNPGRNMTKDVILFSDRTYPYYLTFSTNITDDMFFRKLLENLTY
jgi:hypothetical protein